MRLGKLSLPASLKLLFDNCHLQLNDFVISFLVTLCSVYIKHFSLRCWEWTKHGPWCWAALVWDTCFCLDLGSSQSHSKMWVTTSTSQGRRGRTGWNGDAEVTVRCLVPHSVTRFLWMGAAEYFQYSVTYHDTIGPVRSTVTRRLRLLLLCLFLF